jgi:hypothetical protein
VEGKPSPRERAGRTRGRGRRGWQAGLASQVQRLSDELETLPAPPEEARAEFEGYRRVVERHLERAREALEPAGPIRALRDWYSGASVEAASTSLHRASEVLLVIQSPAALASELPDIMAAFESNLAADDPRRLELKPALEEAARILLHEQQLDAMTVALRAKLRAARRAANAVSSAAQASVRRWRNALVWAGASVTLLVLALAVIHAFVPDFLSLEPAEPKGAPAPVQPWAVELVGAAGGALAALLALTRFSGFTDPFGLPTAQALLRIPTAAATSLFGVVLMQTAALDVLRPQQNGTKVLAFAFLFGYAQEPLLRMIDRQAGKVLDPARDKSEPAKPSSPQPAKAGGG